MDDLSESDTNLIKNLKPSSLVLEMDSTYIWV